MQMYPLKTHQRQTFSPGSRDGSNIIQEEDGILSSERADRRCDHMQVEDIRDRIVIEEQDVDLIC